MTFTNKNTGDILSLFDLFTLWRQFKTEDPFNHATTFKRELFDIIDATLKGRNDLKIIGVTRTELFNLYTKLMTEV